MSTLLLSCIKEPEACFDLSYDSYTINDDITFDNCSKNVDRYEWDFGDGNRSEEKAPMHRYSKPGHYTAILRAYNDKGEDDFAVNIDVGRYFLSNLQIDSIHDTVTDPRHYMCNGIWFTDNLEAMGHFFGGEDCDGYFHNRTTWGDGDFSAQTNVELPHTPEISFIHSFLVNMDTGVFQGQKTVFDTLYPVDTNLVFDLRQQRTFEGIWFKGNSNRIKADFSFDIFIDEES